MDNLFDSMPSKLDSEVFQCLLKAEKVRIERIVSKGHTSPEHGWYDQDQNEWVLVVRGEAILTFEDGESFRLKEGDFTNIRAHQKHRVSWTEPNIETIWLAVHY